jgi:putative addiction module component (TIGR02574 family)
MGVMAGTLDITKLTTEERLDLIGELWDSIAPADLRLTPAQEAEVARRMASFDTDAKAAIPWEDFEKELDKRHR